MRTRRFLIPAIAGLALTVAACSEGGKDESVRKQEERTTAVGFERMVKSQQVPTFDYSQERQTLIDVLTMRAEGTHGTAYATTLTGELLWWCPSVGAPVPSTYQLTNPEQIVSQRDRGLTSIPLGEATGVYTGASAATWTVCLDDNGTPFGKYEEANVGWTSGVVDGLPSDKQARVDEITFEFSEAQE